MQLLINMADNDFGRSKRNEDEARILSAFSMFKKSTKVGYLTSGIKKCDQTAKRGGNGAKNTKYLISKAKKAFNLLQHAFI